MNAQPVQTTELILTGTRVTDICAASKLSLKTVAKKLGCSLSALKAAHDLGVSGDLAIRLVEFEDGLPKAYALGNDGAAYPSTAASATEQPTEEAPPTTRDRKGPRRAPRPAATSEASPAEGTPTPPAAPSAAEVIPPAPPEPGTRAYIAQEIREGGTFNERAEGLVKGNDWAEAYVPLPMDLHERCQRAAKALGVSLKQFRTYAFLRLVSEIENAEG